MPQLCLQVPRVRASEKQEQKPKPMKKQPRNKTKQQQQQSTDKIRKKKGGIGERGQSCKTPTLDNYGEDDPVTV